ncbi:MAG: response regulator transcription factor [Rhodothermales bacterium]|nr:response regulator transcription factor [Rhodothermales bacterium]
MQNARILLVEDDAELSDLVRGRLVDSGYNVEVAEDGTNALEKVAASVPDLVLLDVMLPGLDGLEVCRRIRSDHPLLYIIMLTARTSEMDRVVGLEVGADDYVTKPFSLDELIARVRSALRRIRLTAETTNVDDGEESTLDFGAILIDPIRREVKLNGSLLHLTVREYDLLLFMARNPGRPFSRMQLLEKVWDIHYEGYDRTVDSHVQRLRAKIEADPADPFFIRTVWGVGYKFEVDPVEA